MSVIVEGAVWVDGKVAHCLQLQAPFIAAQQAVGTRKFGEDLRISCGVDLAHQILGRHSGHGLLYAVAVAVIAEFTNPFARLAFKPGKAICSTTEIASFL